jgi:hypothetical protein
MEKKLVGFGYQLAGLFCAAAFVWGFFTALDTATPPQVRWCCAALDLAIIFLMYGLITRNSSN